MTLESFISSSTDNVDYPVLYHYRLIIPHYFQKTILRFVSGKTVSRSITSFNIC